MTERDYAETAENCPCVVCFQASACFPIDEGGDDDRA